MMYVDTMDVEIVRCILSQTVVKYTILILIPFRYSTTMVNQCRVHSPTTRALTIGNPRMKMIPTRFAGPMLIDRMKVFLAVEAFISPWIDRFICIFTTWTLSEAVMANFISIDTFCVQRWIFSKHPKATIFVAKIAGSHISWFLFMTKFIPLETHPILSLLLFLLLLLLFTLNLFPCISPIWTILLIRSFTFIIIPSRRCCGCEVGCTGCSISRRTRLVIIERLIGLVRIRTRDG